MSLGIDERVGLGAVIEILLLIVGGAGGWATMKVMQKIMLERITDLKGDVDADRKANGERHEQNVERMNALELKIASECLKKDDFRDFERRFNEKVDRIEHAAGNAATKAAGIIADLLRSSGRVRD